MYVDVVIGPLHLHTLLTVHSNLTDQGLGVGGAGHNSSGDGY